MYFIPARTELESESLLKLPILIRPLLCKRPPRLPSLPKRSPALNLPLNQHIPKSVAQDVSLRF